MMTYECAFDFTICKPKKSKFIGKSGVIEFETNDMIDIEIMKTDERLINSIAHELNTTLKQKNIFMITVKSITPTQKLNNGK